MAIVLEKRGFRAEFSEQSGAMLRLANTKTGWEIYGDREQELFEMNIMLPGREKNIALSSQQKLTSYELKDNVLTLVWNTIHVEYAKNLDIRFTAVITAENDGFRFDGTLENHSKHMVEHLSYPCISDLQRPTHAKEFHRKNWKYAEMANVELYPHFRNEYGYWSNEFPFQRVAVPESNFVLMEDGKEGLYVGCHDTNIPYSLQYFYQLKPGLGDTFRQEISTPTDDGSIVPWVNFTPVHLLFLDTGMERTLMTMVLAAYEGDWQNGVDRYKAWRKTWHKPAPIPQWATEPHAWYQVQMTSYGDGLRRKFSDLPKIAKTCLKHGITVIQVTGWTLQGQDGCMPCHDPDPRLGTWEELKNVIAECEQMGVHIILYMKFNFADTRTEWFRNELYKYASRDKFGDIQAHVGYYYERPSILSGVNSHRLAVMCQHSAGWQRTCRMEFKKALELGASGILIDEVQHHNNMPLCFDPTHGHPVPAHTFAGDLVLADQLLEMCREEGREDFLISGEACLDIQSTRYPFAYFRIGEEGGMHQNEMCMPVQRCIDSDYQNLCGVWGHNDRNSLNFCLMYRYVVSYETRHFRGDVDEFPQMLAYGEKMESLRKRYADYLWYTEFLGRHGAEVTGNVLYAVHRSKKTGKLAVVAINLADEAVPCQVSIAGAVALQLVTPETPEAVSFRETLEIPARSAAVIMEC